MLLSFYVFNTKISFSFNLGSSLNLHIIPKSFSSLSHDHETHLIHFHLSHDHGTDPDFHRRWPQQQHLAAPTATSTTTTEIHVPSRINVRHQLQLLVTLSLTNPRRLASICVIYCQCSLCFLVGNSHYHFCY